MALRRRDFIRQAFITGSTFFIPAGLLRARQVKEGQWRPAYENLEREGLLWLRGQNRPFPDEPLFRCLSMQGSRKAEEMVNTGCADNNPADIQELASFQARPC